MMPLVKVLSLLKQYFYGLSDFHAYVNLVGCNVNGKMGCSIYGKILIVYS